MEQYLQEEAIHSDCKSLNSTPDEPETKQPGSFECNICLDLVQDPVVTFCGHLYCWPCIYRWINFQDTSSDNLEPQKPQCPVCKTEVSQNTLIPLYGRGQMTNSCKDDLSNLIPQRPPSPRCGADMVLPNTTTNRSLPRHQLHLPYRSGNYMASPMFDPMIGMFGEMVYSRIFGNSETTLYTYPNSYHLAGSSSPRLRRHIVESDKSLSRVCFFLCCCVTLCLLLF